MNEKLLVRLINIKNDDMIAAFYTSNWSEVYKMYFFIKEQEVSTSITIAEDLDNPSKYDNSEFIVKDISVQFGSNIGLNSLDVYVEVI